MQGRSWQSRSWQRGLRAVRYLCARSGELCGLGRRGAGGHLCWLQRPASRSPLRLAALIDDSTSVFANGRKTFRHLRPLRAGDAPPRALHE